MKDNFLFKLKNNKSDTIERSNYKRLDRYLGDYQPATVTYSNILTRKHILNTDWVSEAQMNTLLRDLAESNYVQLYYGTELIGGSKASFKIVFNVYSSQGDYAVQEDWSFTMVTASGTYTYTAPNDILANYADDLMTSLISSITSTTTIDSVYDMSIGDSGETYGEIVFTAKTVGSIYSNLAMSFVQSVPPPVISAQATLQSNISGQDADPQNFIDCIPNVSEFQFKKKENEPLFQLQCEFTEANTFTRQKL
jgi:hypothetical protein